MDIKALLTQLLAVTKEKHNILFQIQQLTAMQSEAIWRKQMGEFLSLSGKKQQYIEKISQLDDTFEVSYSELHSVFTGDRAASTSSYREEFNQLKDVVQKVQKRTDEIKVLETNNKIEYNRMATQLSEQLRNNLANKSAQIAQYAKIKSLTAENVEK